MPPYPTWLPRPADPGGPKPAAAPPAGTREPAPLDNQSAQAIYQAEADPHVLTGGDPLDVQAMTLEEFQQYTGLDASTLPENEFTPMQAVLNAAGYGMVCPAPSLMAGLPNTTGVLWEGAHLVDFSVRGGAMTDMRGFRAGFWRHVLSAMERNPWSRPVASPLSQLFYPPGATTTLNRGVPGSYANDWMFKYDPRATVVYRTDPKVDPAAFSEYMKSSAPEYAGKTYTFSPPKEGSTAFVEAFGGGCAPPTANCVNLPQAQHRGALGLGPKEPLPFVPEPGAPGRFLDPVDRYFFGNEDLPPGLARARVGPANLAGGVIRVGGTVLLVYGVWHSASRIAEAEPGSERTKVVIEEAGGWTGNLVGGTLSGMLGRAVICAETGPAAFYCMVGTTLVGGVLGGMLGAMIGRDVGDAFVEGGELLADPDRFMEASAWFNSAATNGQSVQDYYEAAAVMAEINGQPLPDNVQAYYDIFHGGEVP